MGEDDAWTLMQSPFQKVPKQLAIHNVLCRQCWMASDIESYAQVQWIGTAQSQATFLCSYIMGVVFVVFVILLERFCSVLINCGWTLMGQLGALDLRHPYSIVWTPSKLQTQHLHIYHLVCHFTLECTFSEVVWYCKTLLPIRCGHGLQPPHSSMFNVRQQPMIFKGCDLGGNHSMGLFQMANVIAMAFGVAARYKLLLLYSHFFTKSSFIFSGKHVLLKEVWDDAIFVEGGRLLGNLALLWALPTPQTFMIIGLAWE